MILLGPNKKRREVDDFFFKKKKKQEPVPEIMPEPAPEVSPGGSRVLRHEEPESRDFIPPAGTGNMDEICAHFDKLFPQRETSVFHEIVSDLLHIDVHIMKPTAEDDFFVIYTTGMSDLPMTLPEDMPEQPKWMFAELFMLLPAHWNPGAALSLSTEIPHSDYWPINLIKLLARLPHDYKTWLGAGHTIPNGPDYEPLLEGSDMAGAVIMGVDESYSPLKLDNGDEINFYMAIPASQAEIEYKLGHGMDAMCELFDEHKVSMIVDIFRKSCI